MRSVTARTWIMGLCLICLGSSVAMVFAQDEAAQPDNKQAADKTSASRLRAIREIMSRITMESTAGKTPQKLELKPDPLLRYNDVTRTIADSVIFRVGTKGRPVALISAELYGRNGNDFLLNHEFVALHKPQLHMQRDQFVWEPADGTLQFQEFTGDTAPSDNARLRLTQMRRLSEQFTASQMVGASRIELRRMATPLDRYTPSDNPKSDGSMFVFVWGVNPEAALFIETDGAKWRYAWAPLSSAPLEAKLDKAIVWKCPPGPHEDRTASYTSIHRSLTVPDYFDQPSEEDQPAKKSP